MEFTSCRLYLSNQRKQFSRITPFILFSNSCFVTIFKISLVFTAQYKSYLLCLLFPSCLAYIYWCSWKSIAYLYCCHLCKRRLIQHLLTLTSSYLQLNSLSRMKLLEYHSCWNTVALFSFDDSLSLFQLTFRFTLIFHLNINWHLCLLTIHLSRVILDGDVIDQC